VRTRQFLDATFTIAGQNYSFREAIYFSRPRFAGSIGRPLGRAGEPLDLLAYCHGEGHAEKEDPFPFITPQPVTRHSPFGYQLAELPNPNQVGNLTHRLNGLNWEELTQKHDSEALRQLFVEALGDTRFPINEVTLWDWSSVVASLYKAELARYCLTAEWRTRNQLRWSLLRVNFDVLGLYAKAIKIADLLRYRQAVDEVCAAVKQLVEEEYPLGNEVYRDTTGIYFTFPDLDLPAELAQEIRCRVEEIEMELAPRIEVGQASGTTATEQLKKLLAEQRDQARKELTYPIVLENLNPCWRALWENLPEGKWELCPVCRLRPMREKREVCEHCERRRQSRVALWERDPSKTIWLDEIADHNDRVALIVGKFGLDDWLSGDLVQTMLVKAVENNPDACVPKNPSPARLRRVWETCRRFWTETVGGILEHYRFGGGDALRCTRVAVVPDSPTRWQENVPYDGTINGKAVSLLWQQNEGRFITIGNLQLGVAQARDETGLVGEWHGRECIVTLPDRPGRTRTFTVKCVELLNGEEMRTYAPYLTLLESPDRCLTLVPAAEVLDIAEQIKDEYEKQMGKVQNRLPLFLGVVFFQRKLPLMAVMDTARRMLEQVEFEGKTWKITQVSNGSVAFENSITCDVLTTMGDGSPDHWYPYFFVEGDPRPRQRCFRHNGHWLVHVSDLHVGDTVCVTPSRFAYIYLEHTAQRFRFDPNRDVMLLDELPRLRKMWQDICKPDMTDTKLQAIHALFESKRQAWGLEEPITDETFRHLVKTTLNRDKVQGVAVEDVLNGCFRRCVDLHWHILKCRVSDEQKKEEQK